MTNVLVTINEDSDDAHDTISGFPGYVDGTSIIYGSEDTFRIYVSGVVFNGLNIPAGATIDSATVAFIDNDFGSGGDVGPLTIFAGDVDSNALGYNSSAAGPADRATTTASDSWTVNVGSTGTATTPQLIDQFQEIVNSYGAIVSADVLIHGDTSIGFNRDFKAFNDSPDSAATLNLDYTAGAGGGDTHTFRGLMTMGVGR